MSEIICAFGLFIAGMVYHSDHQFGWFMLAMSAVIGLIVIADAIARNGGRRP